MQLQRLTGDEVGKQSFLLAFYICVEVDNIYVTSALEMYKCEHTLDVAHQGAEERSNALPPLVNGHAN